MVLSGAGTPQQLESNLAALDIELDDEALSTLRALAEPPEVYWQARASLAWT